MPTIPPVVLARLLGSIEADNLVMLCGAGLSVPAPANLLSAVRVSQICYDRWLPSGILPAALRNDIDALAGHFHTAGQFKSVFINALVPWNELVGTPNGGHAATADFLICRAVKATLSSNFDPLIEAWAMDKKVFLRGALTGQEASSPQFLRASNPLLKFHGCLVRDPEQTLWTQLQLPEAGIAERVQSCTDWMTLNLPGRDLLIVGFWSDWGYLNDVIANALAIGAATSITVVDPSTTLDLAAKAPSLWAKLSGTAAPFEHVQASGELFLTELRAEFSKVWARKFFALGRSMFEDEGHLYSPALADLTAMALDDLYDLRRDGEGRPYYRASTCKAPEASSAQAAFAGLLLVHSGADRLGAWYDHGGVTIRVVHGGGRSISAVRQEYNEPPTLHQPDIVLCAGALDLGTPGRIIASGFGSSVVRPASGGAARWLTLDEARTELAI